VVAGGVVFSWFLAVRVVGEKPSKDDIGGDSPPFLMRWIGEPREVWRDGKSRTSRGPETPLK